MLDAVNAIIYALEGDIDMAIISLICTIPIVGSLIGLPIKYAMRCGVDIGMAFMKFGIRNAPEITEGVSRLARAMKSKYDDASAWVSKKFAKFTPDGGRVGNVVPESLLKGKADTRVYLGVKDGEIVYVGITKDIATRQKQHGDRFDYLREITTEPLTRRQARAIEQAMIEANPQFTNKINSISSRRDWYNDAISWGKSWLEEKGYLN